jgi:hypothetical protein
LNGDIKWVEEMMEVLLEPNAVVVLEALHTEALTEIP